MLTVDRSKLTTDKEVVEAVVAFMKQQNTYSYSESEESCGYRGVNGTACAVGCLISDSEYHTSFEGNDVTGLISVLADFVYEGENRDLFEFIITHRRVLDVLQTTHDNAYMTDLMMVEGVEVGFGQFFEHQVSSFTFDASGKCIGV